MRWGSKLIEPMDLLFWFALSGVCFLLPESYRNCVARNYCENARVINSNRISAYTGIDISIIFSNDRSFGFKTKCVKYGIGLRFNIGILLAEKKRYSAPDGRPV